MSRPQTLPSGAAFHQEQLDDFEQLHGTPPIITESEPGGKYELSPLHAESPTEVQSQSYARGSDVLLAREIHTPRENSLTSRDQRGASDAGESMGSKVKEDGDSHMPSSHEEAMDVKQAGEVHAAEAQSTSQHRASDAGESTGSKVKEDGDSHTPSLHEQAMDVKQAGEVRAAEAQSTSQHRASDAGDSFVAKEDGDSRTSASHEQAMDVKQAGEVRAAETSQHRASDGGESTGSKVKVDGDSRTPSSYEQAMDVKQAGEVHAAETQSTSQHRASDGGESTGSKVKEDGDSHTPSLHEQAMDVKQAGEVRAAEAQSMSQHRASDAGESTGSKVKEDGDSHTPSSHEEAMHVKQAGEVHAAETQSSSQEAVQGEGRAADPFGQSRKQAIDQTSNTKALGGSAAKSSDGRGVKPVRHVNRERVDPRGKIMDKRSKTPEPGAIKQEAQGIVALCAQYSSCGTIFGLTEHLAGTDSAHVAGIRSNAHSI